MKTIVVFTDHSKQSEHAVRYAIHLAKKIKANILLSDAIKLPNPVLNLHAEGFDNNFEENEPVKNNRLINFCNLLENELAENTLPGKFSPAIYCYTEIGTISEAVKYFHETLDITFTICAVNFYYGSHSIMTGEVCGQLLASTLSPIIIVPESAPIRYAEKYTFLADITSNNTIHLTETSKLAELSAAEVMIVDINNGRPLDAEQEIAIKSIMRDTIHQIEYGRIYYRHLPNHVIKSDLEWLFQENRFEMLVMVYRKTSILNQVLRFDFTDKLIGNVDVPLLIYPSID